MHGQVPIVVAINKIDKPGADVERVKQEMAGQPDLLPEEWGGTVPYVLISAKKGTGIPELLETLALVAEVEDFQANPNRLAEGTVLEALLGKKVGALCTLLVQAGTLRVRTTPCHVLLSVCTGRPLLFAVPLTMTDQG